MDNHTLNDSTIRFEEAYAAIKKEGGWSSSELQFKTLWRDGYVTYKTKLAQPNGETSKSSTVDVEMAPIDWSSPALSEDTVKTFIASIRSLYEFRRLNKKQAEALAQSEQRPVPYATNNGYDSSGANKLVRWIVERYKLAGKVKSRAIKRSLPLADAKTPSEPPKMLRLEGPKSLKASGSPPPRAWHKPHAIKRPKDAAAAPETKPKLPANYMGGTAKAYTQSVVELGTPRPLPWLTVTPPPTVVGTPMPKETRVGKYVPVSLNKGIQMDRILCDQPALMDYLRNCPVGKKDPPDRHDFVRQPVRVPGRPDEIKRRINEFLKNPNSDEAKRILNKMAIKPSELSIDRLNPRNGGGLNCIWNLYAMPVGDNSWFGDADDAQKQGYVGEVAWAVSERAHQIFLRKNELIYDWGADMGDLESFSMEAKRKCAEKRA